MQVRTLFVSGLPLDIKPRELYLLFRPFKVLHPLRGSEGLRGHTRPMVLLSSPAGLRGVAYQAHLQAGRDCGVPPSAWG